VPPTSAHSGVILHISIESFSTLLLIVVIMPYLLSESVGFKYYVGDYVTLIMESYPLHTHSRLTIYIYNVFEHLLLRLVVIQSKW
jgi:hypothetical protein